MNRFVWTERAIEQLRQIDREQALEILHSLTDYANSGKGQMKPLKGAAICVCVSAHSASSTPPRSV